MIRNVKILCPIFVMILIPTIPAMEIPKVYYLGDCVPASSPIGYIGDDPALEVVAVPATAHPGYFTGDQVSRYLRQYLPRTYQDLISGNMILLSDVRADTLGTKWLNWFSKSITEDGLSLMMVGGILSFGGYSGSPSWDITSIGHLLPVELIDGMTVSVDWKPDVTSPDDPLMTALPWRTCPIFHGYNKVTLKDGAKLLAQTDDGKRNPFMALWKIEDGLSFAFCTDWTPGWGATFQKWEYYPDFTVDSVYYTLGRGVPQDLGLMHMIRYGLLNYRVHRDIMIAMLGFVEKVGANVLPLEERIHEADIIRQGANDLYICEDYEACLETLDKAREELVIIEKETLETKARAMLWIWMVEWLIVTSTLMITGILLWTVMIRRRLYREVGITRAR